MSQKQAVESEDGLIRVNPGQTGATEAIERLREAMDTLARKRHSVGANERQDSAGLTRAMVARFEGAIETDSAGQSALRRLRNQRIENMARLDSRVPFKRLLPGASVMTLTLHDRLSFLFPPYDFEWHWGNAKQTVADRATGSAAALGESGHFAEGNDGPIHAASGNRGTPHDREGVPRIVAAFHSVFVGVHRCRVGRVQLRIGDRWYRRVSVPQWSGGRRRRCSSVATVFRLPRLGGQGP